MNRAEHDFYHQIAHKLVLLRANVQSEESKELVHDIIKIVDEYFFESVQRRRKDDPMEELVRERFL